MAVIWKKDINGIRYEVRTAGNTRRLYTNGVVHSQFNPLHPVTGSVWDLLLLPAFFYHQDVVKRVLVLGVGGGAVIRQLLHFLAPERIVGVDLDPVHLYVAKRFFGVNREKVQLIESDAAEWMQRYRGTAFDLIIDDVFRDSEGEPFRAIGVTPQWVDALLKHLSADGAVVANFLSPSQLRESAYVRNSTVRCRFKSAFQLTHPRTENAIGVFLKQKVDARTLRVRLKTIPELNPTRTSSRLQYRIRKI